ncbi:MAG: bifunctional 4'-phosphopantothenoylcysteine decarboxylase/phosphopantothenoylcysteine synthetase, partial [Phycisphaerae bacterium]|nr:bifunctional 4'-phosphopantothenoylcysteine decarboxylase/phosphopantothenoylcysteine synthetase [Phycisphaerae bacterium]
VVSRLVQKKAAVTVAMTDSATRLIGPPTFRALTSRPVYTDLWAQEISADIEHISLADRADLVVVAPATANILAKMAAGIADDLVSTTLLAVEGPVLLAPAMNVRMWSNPATGHNVEILKQRGHILVGPESGWQACGHVGIGRMAEPQTIVQAIEKILAQRKPKPAPDQ